MVEAGRAHRLAALGQQDELVSVGEQDVAALADDLGVGRLPPEYGAVEGVDLLAELVGQCASGEGELHVVEPHRPTVDPGPIAWLARPTRMDGVGCGKKLPSECRF